MHARSSITRSASGALLKIASYIFVAATTDSLRVEIDG
jgi:hypothetical protein